MSTLEFNRAFGQQQKGLMAFAVRLTRNPDDAKDLLQETAMKAYKNRNSYKPETNLRAWLMTIMRNTFINDYRKQKRRRELEHGIQTAGWLGRSASLTRNGGETGTAVGEIVQELIAMDDWMKVPFLMHYQGYRYQEVAQHLGLPLGTVKSRIFMARKHLRSRMCKLYSPEALAEILRAG